MGVLLRGERVAILGIYVLTALVVQCHLLFMHVKSKQCRLTPYHNNRDKITLEATVMTCGHTEVATAVLPWYVWPNNIPHHTTIYLLIWTHWDQRVLGWVKVLQIRGCCQPTWYKLYVSLNELQCYATSPKWHYNWHTQAVTGTWCILWLVGSKPLDIPYVVSARMHTTLSRCWVSYACSTQ